MVREYFAAGFFFFLMLCVSLVVFDVRAEETQEHDLEYYKQLNLEYLTPNQQLEVIELIQTFIQNNPVLIYESMQSGRITNQGRSLEQSRNTVRSNTPDIDALTDKEKELLYGSALDPIINGSGPTVIEFFDYSCIYCKASKDVLRSFHAKYPDIKWIYKEFPILGPESIYASKIGLAIAEQDIDAYMEYHLFLMNQRGNPSREMIHAFLKESNLDQEAIEKHANSNDISEKIEQTKAIADKLPIRATPSIIIGDTIFTRIPTFDELEDALNNLQ